jgi:hypothetical protein
MSNVVRETLLVPQTLASATRALDNALSDRGFDKVELPQPAANEGIARAEKRFFEVSACGETVTAIREWMGYQDATPWSAAIELSEGLPAATRMELALPPGLSILARALSRSGVAVGAAARSSPVQIVVVVFRGGRASDVFTYADGRVMSDASSSPRPMSATEARSALADFLRSASIDATATDLIFPGDDLPSTWPHTYLHRDAQ